MNDDNGTGTPPKEVQSSDINFELPPLRPLDSNSSQKTLKSTSESGSNITRVFFIKKSEQQQSVNTQVIKLNCVDQKPIICTPVEQKPIIIPAKLNDNNIKPLIIGTDIIKQEIKPVTKLRRILAAPQRAPIANLPSVCESPKQSPQKIVINKSYKHVPSNKAPISLLPISTLTTNIPPGEKRKIKIVPTPILHEPPNSSSLEKKRLVRKFCLKVSPSKHNSLYPDSNTITNPINRSGRLERIYNLEEIPKLGRPMKIPVPKVLKLEYNRNRDRSERIVMLPAREVRLTEAETQTEEIHFRNSWLPLQPQLRKIGDNSEDGKTNLKRNCFDEEEPLPVKKRPSILRAPEKKKMQNNKQTNINDITTASSSTNISIDASNNNIKQNNDTITEESNNKPLTELECIKAKLNLSDKDVERAKYEYQNCVIADSMGNLPLHRAIISNHEPSIIRQAIILKACINHINIRNNNLMTPIHLALIHGCTSLALRKLINLGGRIDLKDKDGNTVLHLAVRYCPADHLTTLLPLAKTLVNVINLEGNTALHLAALENKIEHYHFLASVPYIDVNIPDGKSGRTALFLAIENRHFNFARLLVRRGGDRDICNFAGQTIMTLGSENKQLKGVITLLSKKRINKKEWERVTNNAYNGDDNDKNDNDKNDNDNTDDSEEEEDDDEEEEEETSFTDEEEVVEVD